MSKRWMMLAGWIVAYTSTPGLAADATVEPLPEKDWPSVVVVTGLHSLYNRKLGFAMRIVEVDGSASVAQNPVAVFVVVTNEVTEDYVARIWRLPTGVEKVRGVVASKCGLQISVDLDNLEDPNQSPRGVSTTHSASVKACFFDEKGRLQSKLRVHVSEGTK